MVEMDRNKIILCKATTNSMFNTHLFTSSERFRLAMETDAITAKTKVSAHKGSSSSTEVLAAQNGATHTDLLI